MERGRILPGAGSGLPWHHGAYWTRPADSSRDYFSGIAHHGSSDGLLRMRVCHAVYSEEAGLMPHAYAKPHSCQFCGLVTKVANYHWRYWSQGENRIIRGLPPARSRDVIRLSPHERACADRPRTPEEWQRWWDGPKVRRFECCAADYKNLSARTAGASCYDCGIWRCAKHIQTVSRVVKEVREVAPGVYKPVSHRDVAICKGGCKKRSS